MIVYTPPPDKSITIRAAVLAALSRKKIKIKNPLICDDTISTFEGLKKLGVSLTLRDNTLIIEGVGLYGFRKNVEIDVGESGLFLRLILPVLLNQQASYKISGRRTILRRNFKDTLEPFLSLGCKIEHRSWHLPFIIYPSTIGSGSFETFSAQVKSSLLITSLYGADIWVKELLPVRDHTENLLRYFGVRIVNKDGFIKAKGVIKPKDLVIYGDISSASPIITGAVLKGLPIKVKGCFLNKRRIGFLKLLKKTGVDVIFDVKRKVMGEPVGNVLVRPSEKLKAVSVDDISDMIDEVPLAALVLSYADGISKIKGVSRISNKESDRLSFTLKLLKALGSFKDYQTDCLIIKGGEVRKIYKVETNSDHRSAMVGGVVKAINNPLVRITHPDCVSKTYPNFWKDMERFFGVKV